jgi:hypothetical protein
VLYLLANLDFTKEVFSKQYQTSVECIKKRSRSFLPHLIHHISRGVYHAANGSLDEDVMQELVLAIGKHMSCSYAFTFTKIGVILPHGSIILTIY